MMIPPSNRIYETSLLLKVRWTFTGFFFSVQISRSFARLNYVCETYNLEPLNEYVMTTRGRGTKMECQVENGFFSFPAQIGNQIWEYSSFKMRNERNSRPLKTCNV